MTSNPSSTSSSDLRRVSVKLAVFATLFATAFVAAHVWARHAALPRPIPSDCIFLCGDSQVRDGVDAALLGTSLDRPVIGLFASAAGPYDLQILADRLPSGCDVVIGIGFPMLARTENRDYMRSGISLTGLRRQLAVGYGPSHLKRLAMRGRDVRGYTKPTVWSGRGDSSRATVKAAYDRVRVTVATPGSSLRFSRRRALLAGVVATLAEKGCRVVVVRPPQPAQLDEIAASSVFARYDEFLRSLRGANVEVLAAPSGWPDELFSDATHLNYEGRAAFTRWLSDALTDR